MQTQSIGQAPLTADQGAKVIYLFTEPSKKEVKEKQKTDAKGGRVIPIKRNRISGIFLGMRKLAAMFAARADQ